MPALVLVKFGIKSDAISKSRAYIKGRCLRRNIKIRLSKNIWKKSRKKKVKIKSEYKVISETEIRNLKPQFNILERQG